MGGSHGAATPSDYAHLQNENAKALQLSRSRVDRAWDFLEAFQIALIGVIMAVVGLVVGG